MYWYQPRDYGEREELKHVLKEIKEIFTEELPKKLPPKRVVKMKIELQKED